jgi:hypothetical protein
MLTICESLKADFNKKISSVKMTYYLYIGIALFHKLTLQAVGHAFAILQTATGEFDKAEALFLFVAQQNFVMFINQQAVYTYVEVIHYSKCFLLRVRFTIVHGISIRFSSDRIGQLGTLQ